MHEPSVQDSSIRPPASAAEPQVAVITQLSDRTELVECIDSVLGQTHRNLEYLLVDFNGSKSTLALAEDYARRDPRVRVLRRERGLSRLDAVNSALGRVNPRSAYFKIVDASDLLFPSCLREMVAVAEPEPNVAIVSSYRLRGSTVDGLGLAQTTRLLSGRDACRMHLLDGIYLFGSPTRLLFRTELLAEREPFFASGRLHADTEAVFEILANHDLGFVHLTLSSTRGETELLDSAVQAFGEAALDRFIVVSQYGPVYLDAAEYARCLKGAMRWYYSVLAHEWVRERMGHSTPGFWKYHRAGLRTIGEEIRPELLAFAVARLSARKVLAPWRKVRGIEVEPESFRGRR